LKDESELAERVRLAHLAQIEAERIAKGVLCFKRFVFLFLNMMMKDEMMRLEKEKQEEEERQKAAAIALAQAAEEGLKDTHNIKTQNQKYF
jgi:hypothetical protein